MKRSLTTFALWSLATSCVYVATSSGAGEPETNPYIKGGYFDVKVWLKNRKAPASDRTTDEALASTKAQHPIPYGKEFVPTEKPMGPARVNFYQDSIILAGAGMHTVIPQEALLHLPEKLISHRVDKPSGRSVWWPEFLSANRAWLRLHEVTLDQANGTEPIAPEVKESFVVRMTGVVATFKSFPITVKPPAAAVAEEAIASVENVPSEEHPENVPEKIEHSSTKQQTRKTGLAKNQPPKP